MLVDLHNHILPGLDDGPTSELEAIALIQNAVDNGVTHIVATPHHRNGMYFQKVTEINNQVQKLNTYMHLNDIPVRIYPGMEVRLHGELIAELGTDTLTLANSHKYILVELPNHQIPQFTESIFYDLQLKGYIPVIAHAEMNAEIRRHPKKLVDLVHKGALVQVTAGSVSGARGKNLQKFTLKLCQHQLVHFIASDAHNLSKRPFLIKHAYHVIRSKFSEEYVNYLQQNAIHVINGVEFQLCPPIVMEKV